MKEKLHWSQLVCISRYVIQTLSSHPENHIILQYDVSSSCKSGGATWPTSGANRVLPEREKRRHQWRLSESVWGLWASTPASWDFSMMGFGVGYFSSRVLATGWSLSLETNGCQYQEICSNYFFDHFLPFTFFLLSLLLSLSLLKSELILCVSYLLLLFSISLSFYSLLLLIWDTSSVFLLTLLFFFLSTLLMRNFTHTQKKKH